MNPRPVEFEVLPGLVDVAAEEIGAELGSAIRRGPDQLDADGTRLGAELEGSLAETFRLRTVVAVHAVQHFGVPRPRALLGDQAVRAITEGLRGVVALHPPGTFSGLRIGAAGSDSAVLRRLAATLAASIGLPAVDDGDLLVRVRPAAGTHGPAGWDVLTRLTPRPLSTRAWRVARFPAALNATLAAAMVRLSGPRPGERVANPVCGSGTLLIERLAAGPTASCIGLDHAAGALRAARDNLERAGALRSAQLVAGDAGAAPLATGSVDCILADLPYGHRSGSHRNNETLYPAFLAESHRVLARDGRLVVITHELRRFERLVADGDRWRTRRRLQVFQKGHHPCIWVLEPCP